MKTRDGTCPICGAECCFAGKCHINHRSGEVEAIEDFFFVVGYYIDISMDSWISIFKGEYARLLS